MSIALPARAPLRGPTISLRDGVRRLAEAAVTPLVPADVLDMFHPLRRGADLRGRIIDVHPETADAATHPDPARQGLGRPRARPVRPDRHRRRRRPGVARLLPDPRAPRRRPDLDHRQGRPRRQGQQPPGPRGPPRHPRPARAGGRRLRARRAARQAAVRHRRLRHHPGDRDAAQPVPGRPTAASCGCPAAATSTSSSSTWRPPSRDSIFLDNLRDARRRRRHPAGGPVRRRARHARRGRPRRRWCPTWPSARRTPVARPDSSTRSRPTTTRPGSSCSPSSSAPPRVVTGEGGTVTFAKNGTVVEADGATPILDAAEDAGVLMPSGCRMGICYGCVLPLREGAVRDLRNGELTTVTPASPTTAASSSRPASTPPPAPATSTTDRSESLP